MPPAFTEPGERERARAAIEPVVARDVFGLAREELEYILDTFPLVRERDEKLHGEYRTKLLILEAYETAGRLKLKSVWAHASSDNQGVVRHPAPA